MTDEHYEPLCGTDTRARAGGLLRLLRPHESQPDASSAGFGAPGFPTVEALKALNRRIHEDAGTPERYRLDEPAPLHSRLERETGAWRLDQDAENIVRVAALLAHGIAQAQASVDGNRRTAYFTARQWFEAKRPRSLSRAGVSDDMRAVPTAETIEAMLLRRLPRTKRCP